MSNMHINDEHLVKKAKKTEGSAYAQNLEVFPNPAKEFVRINNLSGTHEVSIMTLQGQTIKKATVTNESDIDITDLNAGVYFLYTDAFLSKFIKL